jgi:hypothetical protein
MSYNGCGRKRVYYRRSQALHAIKLSYKKYGTRMYFYECPWCGWWHLSKHDHRRKRYTIRTMGLTFYQ